MQIVKAVRRQELGQSNGILSRILTRFPLGDPLARRGFLFANFFVLPLALPLADGLAIFAQQPFNLPGADKIDLVFLI